MKTLLSTPLINIQVVGRDESLENIQEALSSKQIKKMRQKHTANFALVSSQSPFISENTDGLITLDPSVALAVNAADCLPVLGWHESGIRFAIHAGRIGTEKGILKNTLTYLRNEFKIKDDLQLWFGPHICSECYEIDRETKLHYDLQSENIKQAESVFPELKENIRHSEYCTYHHSDQWYSYRKEGKGVPMNWFVISPT